MSVLQKDNNGNITNYTGITSANEGLPLGFIFTSALPQLNTNYHLLNGDSVLITNYSEFYTLLTTLVSQSWNLTCSANEYAEDIAKTGNCGKFVINTTSSDVTGTYDTTTITVSANSFKLPKITRFIQGISSITDLGNSVEAGLPNITGNIYKNDSEPISFKPATNITSSGALGATKETKGVNGGTLVSGYQGLTGITFDASLSNSTYGNSNTVQPNATQYPYYIVLKNNSNSGLMNYLTTAGVQSLGGATGDITLQNGIQVLNNVLNLVSESLTTNVTKTNQHDTVVESYISSDGLTWYRKWASGWKECGGSVDSSSTLSGSTINFPLSFSNSNSYEIFSSLLYNNSPAGEGVWFGYNTKTINSVKIGTASANVYHYCYYCCGY